jgi:hypothetical protein
LIIPAWKPELASLKEIADAIITPKWLCDEVLTAAGINLVTKVASLSRNHSRKRSNQIK